MEIKNRFTGEVIHSGDFKTMKELLLDAIEQGANLGYANLRGANLEDANLEDANLRGANLRGANLRGCAGNRLEIKSLFISGVYSITYTSEYLQIGCESHAISDWWDFNDERIKNMDGKSATLFWSENREFIRLTIEKFPAKPALYREGK